MQNPHYHVYWKGFVSGFCFFLYYLEQLRFFPFVFCQILGFRTFALRFDFSRGSICSVMMLSFDVSAGSRGVKMEIENDKFVLFLILFLLDKEFSSILRVLECCHVM